MRPALSLYQETADQNRSPPGEDGNYDGAVIEKQNRKGQISH